MNVCGFMHLWLISKDSTRKALIPAGVAFHRDVLACYAEMWTAGHRFYNKALHYHRPECRIKDFTGIPNTNK